MSLVTQEFFIRRQVPVAGTNSLIMLPRTYLVNISEWLRELLICVLQAPKDIIHTQI